MTRMHSKVGLRMQKERAGRRGVGGELVEASTEVEMELSEGREKE